MAGLGRCGTLLWTVGGTGGALLQLSVSEAGCYSVANRCMARVGGRALRRGRSQRCESDAIEGNPGAWGLSRLWRSLRCWSCAPLRKWKGRTGWRSGLVFRAIVDIGSSGACLSRFRGVVGCRMCRRCDRLHACGMDLPSAQLQPRHHRPWCCLWALAAEK